MRGRRGGKKTRENRDTCMRTTTCALLQTNEFQIYRCISVLLRQSVCPTAIYLDRFDPLSNSHGIVVSSLNIAISLAYQTFEKNFEKKKICSKEEASNDNIVQYASRSRGRGSSSKQFVFLWIMVRNVLRDPLDFDRGSSRRPWKAVTRAPLTDIYKRRKLSRVLTNVSY